jgi:hypothetical protein
VLQETDGHVHWPLGDIVTVQVLEPATETLRLHQLLPFDPADSVAVHPIPESPPPEEPLPEPWLTVMLELPLPAPKDSVAMIWY